MIKDLDLLFNYYLLLNLLIHNLLNINLLLLLNSNSYLLEHIFLIYYLLWIFLFFNPAKNNLVPAFTGENLYTFNHVVSYTRLWI